MDNTETNTEQILHMEKGKYIEIAVKDQGLGITEEHLQKILTPILPQKRRVVDLVCSRPMLLSKNIMDISE